MKFMIVNFFCLEIVNASIVLCDQKKFFQIKGFR